MRKQQKQQYLLGLVMLLGVMLAACFPRQSLIGKWEHTNESTGITETFEFKSNGVFEVSSVNGAGNGIYTFIDDDVVMVVVYDPKEVSGTESFVSKFVVAGDTLTLTARHFVGRDPSDYQQPLEFHRVP
jgi:hypothetical protein